MKITLDFPKEWGILDAQVSPAYCSVEVLIEWPSDLVCEAGCESPHPGKVWCHLSDLDGSFDENHWAS